MDKASEKGEPVMRPLFFDFSSDSMAWETEDEYMFGPDILVAPVMEAGAVSRKVYLPEGSKWTEAYTKKTYEGGSLIECAAPLDIIPVFYRAEKHFEIYG